jgi:hypothetical protein
LLLINLGLSKIEISLGNKRTYIIGLAALTSLPIPIAVPAMAPIAFWNASVLSASSAASPAKKGKPAIAREIKCQQVDICHKLRSTYPPLQTAQDLHPLQ